MKSFSERLNDIMKDVTDDSNMEETLKRIVKHHDEAQEDMKKNLDEAIARGDFDGMEIRGVTFEKDGKKYDGARVFPSKGDIEEL